MLSKISDSALSKISDSALPTISDSVSVFKSLATCGTHQATVYSRVGTEMFVAVFPQKPYKKLGRIFEIFNFAKKKYVRVAGTTKGGLYIIQKWLRKQGR